VGALKGVYSNPMTMPAPSTSKAEARKPIAWLTHPMDLQFLQIQGSGRIQLANGRQLRVGYADQNGHPYKPIGRWLVEQGELKKEDVTMGTIHAWANGHPERSTSCWPATRATCSSPKTPTATKARAAR
jgi:membrane-bound lytic murein transglycosylase A